MRLESAMRRRWNFNHFHLHKHPHRSEIETILEKAIRYAPVKNSVYHFKIDVYGPEWSEEKEALNENAGFFDESQKRDRFNSQVLAPWLLVFRPSPYHYKSGLDDDDNPHTAAACAGIFGYCVSLLANDRGLDASFMKCFGCQRETKGVIANSIANKSRDFYFMIGIGYYDLSKINDEFLLRDEINIRPDTRPHVKRIFRKLIKRYIHVSFLARRMYRYFRKRQKPKEIENIVTWH